VAAVAPTARREDSLAPWLLLVADDGEVGKCVMETGKVEGANKKGGQSLLVVLVVLFKMHLLYIFHAVAAKSRRKKSEAVYI
jgi:hypothetical protein